jgi:hypothetical protein
LHLPGTRTSLRRRVVGLAPATLARVPRTSFFCAYEFQDGRLTSVPELMVSTGHSPRQAFFAKYSAQAVRVLEGMENAPLVLLMGGLRTSAVMCGALARRHAHLLGLGRASVVCPDLPMLLAQETAARQDGSSLRATCEPELVLAWPLAVILSWIPLPKLVGAGAGIAWYTVQMRRVAAGTPIDYALGGAGAIFGCDSGMSSISKAWSARSSPW